MKYIEKYLGGLLILFILVGYFTRIGRSYVKRWGIPIISWGAKYLDKKEIDSLGSDEIDKYEYILEAGSSVVNMIGSDNEKKEFEMVYYINPYDEIIDGVKDFLEIE